MYELVQVSEKCYYINCPAKIGVYVADKDNVYLVDSGNDKDAGRKARQILERNGWHLNAILNTHSNADHIGGNKYLQGQTGCKVYSSGIEAAFTRYPVLEPSFLYGGYPCKDLRHKFLMAQESDVTDFSDESFPKEIEAIPLPGHFFDMVGFRMPDGVVFLADCIWELLFDYFDIRKILIIGPLRVSRDTWPAELEKWEHLSGIGMSVVLGSEKERIAALSRRAQVYVINRENVEWLVNESGIPFDFDMVVIDELSSFKSHKAKRFKALKKCARWCGASWG